MNAWGLNAGRISFLIGTSAPNERWWWGILNSGEHTSSLVIVANDKFRRYGAQMIQQLRTVVSLPVVAALLAACDFYDGSVRVVNHTDMRLAVGVDTTVGCKSSDAFYLADVMPHDSVQLLVPNRVGEWRRFLLRRREICAVLVEYGCLRQPPPYIGLGSRFPIQSDTCVQAKIAVTVAVLDSTGWRIIVD